MHDPVRSKGRCKGLKSVGSLGCRECGYVRGCVGFLRLPWIDSRNFFSHLSGGQKSELRCQQTWFLLEALKESSFYAFLLVSGGNWQPWMFLGLYPCPVDICFYLYMIFALCVCVSLSRFASYKNTSYWIRVHLHHNLKTSTKTLFPNKVPFTGSGLRTSTRILN